MTEGNFDLTLLNTLKGIGFSRSEAMVYLALLHHGEMGTRVVDLIETMRPLKRTTLYSVLSKLEENGYVTISQKADTPRNARIYAAAPPMTLLQYKIDTLNAELKRLKELEPIFENSLNRIYFQGTAFTLADVDDFLRPYIAPLLNSGWTMKSLFKEERVPVLNYSIYDIIFLVEDFTFFGEVPFHLFLFEEDIEHNSELLRIVLKSITAESRNYIAPFLGSTPFDFKEASVQVLGRTLAGFVVSLQKSEATEILLPPILQYFQAASINEVPETIDVCIAVTIPTKNKLFYIWAESKDLIATAIEPILSIEGL